MSNREIERVIETLDQRRKDRSFVSKKKRRKNRGISKRGCESRLSSAAFLDSIFALRITKERKGENCNFVASVVEDSVGRRQFYEINAVRAFSTDFQMGENQQVHGKNDWFSTKLFSCLIQKRLLIQKFVISNFVYLTNQIILILINH